MDQEKKPEELPSDPAARPRRKSTFHDVAKAEEEVAAGRMAREEMDALYPEWVSTRQALGEFGKSIVSPMTETARRVAESMGTPPLGEAMKRMIEAMQADRLRLSSVISEAAASASFLRNHAAPPADINLRFPVKSAETYGLERVQSEVGRVAEIAASLADNMKASAEIAASSLDQSIALVASVQELLTTTRDGMRTSERTSTILLRLTWVLVVLTLVLALREGANLWQESEGLRRDLLSWLASLVSR